MSSASLDNVRVRIAPSPTGNLHIGTARTALFNYLFAKSTNGKFILRIEDTDLERSEEAYIQNIFDGLNGLGLTWDEGPDTSDTAYGPYRQTQRLNLYQTHLQQLLDADKAYHCYCTPEELDSERERRKKANPDDQSAYAYSGRCRDASTRAELATDQTRNPVVRFRVPDNRGEVLVSDRVRGEVTFDSTLIGDFVIQKSGDVQNKGTPTYTFCNVVDDHLMKISHVIRGEDLLPNTPNQIMLYEAFGWEVPGFAHLSLILAADRTKLSKRHGATSVAEFLEKGYLPEAICQFLAHLGWSDPEEKTDEFQTLLDISKRFTLERIANHAAVFDVDKLNHLNGKLIREMEVPELVSRARPFLFSFDLSQYSDEKLSMMLDAVRKNLTLLSDLPEAVSYFFDADITLAGDDPKTVLAKFSSDVIDKADWNSPEDLGARVHDLAEALKPLKTKTVMWAIRGAVTGRTAGADLSKTLYILGKDVVSHRVKTALELTSGQTV